jgi:hypothetical protein
LAASSPSCTRCSGTRGCRSVQRRLSWPREHILPCTSPLFCREERLLFTSVYGNVAHCNMHKGRDGRVGCRGERVCVLRSSERTKIRRARATRRSRGVMRARFTDTQPQGPCLLPRFAFPRSKHVTRRRGGAYARGGNGRGWSRPIPQGSKCACKWPHCLSYGKPGHGSKGGWVGSRHTCVESCAARSAMRVCRHPRHQNIQRMFPTLKTPQKNH